MKNESLIHVKFGYEEAIMCKRSILTSQMNLLRIAKTIEGYGARRLRELDLKTDLQKKIKEAKLGITKIKKSFPELKIPEILQKNKKEEPKNKIHKRKTYDKSIEQQLQDIQIRIEDLQRKSY